jgi:sporulation protein YlmC with PRC-barrel domain
MASSSGYLKREELIGKSVVSKNAKIVGTVLDLAVSTDGRLAIQVQKKTDDPASGDLFIGAEEIQAVGDVILLKNASDMIGSGVASPVTPAATLPPAVTPPPAPVSPPPPPGMTSQGKTCQKCGFVNSPNAKFCIKCGANLVSM